MAYAARFPTVLLWVVSLWGGLLRAQEKAPPPVPQGPAVYTPAPVSPATGNLKALDGGGTVSILGYVLTVLVLGAAGFTVLLRGGFFGVSWGASKTARKLHIEESRMVGNRQHLMVAEYDGRRVLLGVSPGRIDFLCGLESETAGQGLAFSEALSDATSGASSPLKAEAGNGRTKEAQ
jgi:hypothetical protein